MRIKIEQSLLVGGIAAAIWMIAFSFLHETLSVDVREFFRGGNTGGMIIGFLAVGGLLGILCYMVNVATGVRKAAGLRFMACLLFLSL